MYQNRNCKILEKKYKNFENYISTPSQAADMQRCACLNGFTFSQFFSLHSYSWVDTVNSGWSRIIPVYIWRITANISRGLQLRYFADYTVYHKLYTVHCTLYNVQFVQFRLSERFPYFITKWKIINIFEFLWNWKGMILKLILIYYINYIHILIKSLLQLNKNI